MQYRNILLIDDDDDDQEIFLTAMEEVSGLATCTAVSDGATALRKLVAKELHPDVIFLDLNMPLMSGQQFLTEIKKNTDLKNIPVIIFSTSSNPETIKEASRLGAQSFITKPEGYNELINLLGRL
ncbi:response regulator [Flavobacterium sp. DGU11]|uniref:Response regulator n=1 Tax=Flavobacterium arundinis TaxID=3139143 RepID=A0ABU9HRF6_9FLAO